VRDMQGMVLPLYRVEMGRGTAGMAVGRGVHRRPPLRRRELRWGDGFGRGRGELAA
jgi:hypothetical protein